MSIIEFGQEVKPESVGLSQRGVDRIVSLFEQHFADGQHPASQLVILKDEQVILDRTLGVLKMGGYDSVLPSTPFQAFSCTKPLACLCLHQLIEKGLVEVDAPVANYWPEFGQKGKESATIRHVFLHQAGIPQRGLYFQIPNWWNWERVTNFVAELPAEFEPGSQTAYHLVNQGFIVGEVVRRVSGRPIDIYMREEIFEPLGMCHSYLGLPREELNRAAELYWGASDQRNTVLLFRQARHAVMPAATLNTSARDLAIFYQMMLNQGSYNGHSFLKPETVAFMTSPGYAGYDHTLDLYIQWGHGFEVGGERPAEYRDQSYTLGEKSGLATFGHSGQRSCNAWADSETGLVMIYLTNRLIENEENNRRWQSMSDVVWEALI
ncbi:MAG: serine hydrolase domain-containing protein [Chloroflexota bacterium]